MRRFGERWRKTGTSPESALIELFKAEPGLPASGAQQLADYFAQSTARLARSHPSSGWCWSASLTNQAACNWSCIRHLASALIAPGGWRCGSGFVAHSISNCRRPRPTTPSCSHWEPSIRFRLRMFSIFLNKNSVRDILVQALLDAPMFPIRWRWNATRALALPRQRGGRKTPAPLQRMESENLLAAVFPDQLACLENIAGDRVVPEHPLVQQTIDDCLTRRWTLTDSRHCWSASRHGAIELISRDLPEPSPLAHEILNAKPYAFLDNAPLEERRTQAVYSEASGGHISHRDSDCLTPQRLKRCVPRPGHLPRTLMSSTRPCC